MKTLPNNNVLQGRHDYGGRDYLKHLGDGRMTAWWGVHRAGKDRYFWVVGFYGGQGTWGGVCPSEREANDQVVEFVSKSFSDTAVLFDAGNAAGIYRKQHAKRVEFAGNGRDRFPFWADRAYLYRPGGAKHRIVSVTDKKVFVLREWEGRPGGTLTDDAKVARRDCYALDRMKLEQAGEVKRNIGANCIMAFYLDDPKTDMSCVTNADPIKIKELRKAMQIAHPDRGGSSEAFIHARREFERYVRNGEVAA